MRVRFSDDYDHRWPSGAETAYKKGMELTVKHEAGKAAVDAGKAKEVRTPRTSSAKASSGTTPKRGRGRPRRDAAATPAAPAAPAALAPDPAPPARAADEVEAPGTTAPPAALQGDENS